MTVKRMAILGASMRRMKALTMKMETVTLVQEDRICQALCTECTKLIVQSFS